MKRRPRAIDVGCGAGAGNEKSTEFVSQASLAELGAITIFPPRRFIFIPYTFCPSPCSGWEWATGLVSYLRPSYL